ncbi:hypothetical protein [uncultured Jannaschia sp.]|uniref:hypothetical protein n=1 Tax=uncultured Jannaschia sp. TaxID=293347 RepID=UPI00260C89FF|nr:hypothetical protein [uncultured Jannaschia sp.]
MGALGRLTLRVLRALPLGLSLAATLWALSANPFAAPFVERGRTELALALEREVRRTATTAWVAAALDAAVAAGDVDRAAMLIDLARDLDRPVDVAAAESMIASRSGWLASAGDCAACMADAATCPTLAQLGACAVPFELSPLGDANALRRAAQAWMTGNDVDELDAGLALLGLGATGAIVLSGGASAPVKAGAGLLRLARRIGSLSPGLARALRVPIRWDAVPDYLRGSARLADVTDAAALARVSGVAADMGRVRDATSTAEALRLARLVDTPEDASRLARVAEAAGPRTTRSFAVLGKGRVFRATVRLGRLAAGTLVLLWLTLLQAGLVLASWTGRTVWRTLLPAPAASRAPPRRRTPRLGPAGPRPPR